MGRIFISGFESGDFSEWDYKTGNIAVIAARTGMTGNFCLDNNHDMYGYVHKDMGVSKSEVYMYFLIRRENGESYDPAVFAFFAADGVQALGCYMDTTNYRLQFSRTYGSGYLGETSTGIDVNTTKRVELYFKPSTSSDGRLVVKIDGTTVLDFTGVTSDKTNVGQVAFGNYSHWIWMRPCHYIDDIIIDDAEWITLTGEQPHKVSALVPVSDGAEDDMETMDPDVILDGEVAKWSFESGALTTDSKGNAGLTAYGSPAADTGDFREGTACVNLVRASSQYFKVLDSALPAGFPLRYGGTKSTFALSFWMKPATIPGSGVYHEIFCKYLYGDLLKSLELQLSDGKMTARWGFGWYSWDISTWDIFYPSAGQWYHVILNINGPSLAWDAYIYDETADTLTHYVGATPGGALWLCPRDIYIGSYDGGAHYFDGKLDDMRLWPFVLPGSLAPVIRQGGTTLDKYLCVNAVPSNDNLFVRGHTDGDIQTFEMDSISGSVDAVKAVQVNTRSFLDGEPATSHITPVLRLGGTNYLGSASVVPAAPGGASKFWALNPATGIAWTPEDLTGMECGVKLTT